MELEPGTCFEQVCADVGIAVVGGSISSNFIPQRRPPKSRFSQISSRRRSIDGGKQYFRIAFAEIFVAIPVWGMRRGSSRTRVYLPVTKIIQELI